MKRRYYDEPNMSDATLLMKVEDLINIAMGPPDCHDLESVKTAYNGFQISPEVSQHDCDLCEVNKLVTGKMTPTTLFQKNVINYKMIQIVLHILARQMRMLETQVEIRVDEISATKEKSNKKREVESSDTSPSSPKTLLKPQGQIKEKERVAKEKADKDIGRVTRAKEKTDKVTEKMITGESKEKQKAEIVASKDKDPAVKDSNNEDHKSKKKDKASAKEAEKAIKQRENVDKLSKKDKETTGNLADKPPNADIKEKTEKISDQEKDIETKYQKKADKALAKEKGKIIRDQEKAAKVHENTDKAVDEEREKDKTVSRNVQREKDQAHSTTSIVVTEKKGQNEKVLVVEKGPTTRNDSRTRVGSIEVVTVSQFELLKAAVKELKDVAGPMPSPALPDNQKLRDELVKGTASLTDTMQAMQLTARIKAAEQAIGCMADLITQLAASGAIPESLVAIVEDVKAGVEETAAVAAAAGVTAMVTHPSIGTRKSVAIDPNAIQSSQTRLDDIPSRKVDSSRTSTAPETQVRPSTVTSSRSMASTRQSMVSGQIISVSHKEMDVALETLKEDITKRMNVITTKVSAAAETAANTAKAAASKSDVASKLANRITTLNSLVSDYAEQLSGFDSGLTTQMQSFQEQMALMKSELNGGLTLLNQANNNAETTAVTELNERYQGLVTELDITLHAHQGLIGLQKQMEDQLHSLVEQVEMLQEQKADRDEVIDGLRDKADLSRLAGLLTEWDFAAARAELERRLELSHDKFKKQETVWLGALRDLTQITENKAEIIQLLAVRDDAQQQLRDIHERIHKLSDILGEPKAAITTRLLSRGATCGACMIPALMEQTDVNYGAPPPLPALRPRPTGAPEEPCLETWKPPELSDARGHICHRWVGGSHTLLSEAVTRRHAEPMLLQTHPTKRFTGYGDDGRLYMMEEELQPCLECNVVNAEKNTDRQMEGPQGSGGGDQGARL